MRIAQMLAEMRDLGWNGDADEWESYIQECSREDLLDVSSDIRSELVQMRAFQRVKFNPREGLAGTDACDAQDIADAKETL